MVVLHGKLRLTSRDVLLPVLPWIIAFCGNVVANKCTSGLTSLAAPTCEVLTSVKAGTLVIPAAIPLLPKSTKSTKSEGAKGKQASLKSKWGKRNVDKLRLDEVYEGSFNFVYPGDHWLAGINSFEAQGLEDEEASGRHEKRSSVALIPPGPLKYRRGKRLLADQEVPDGRTISAKPSKGSDWVMYVATLLCGPVFFALLACGMSTWLTRQAGSNPLSTSDLQNASNVDDDEGVGFPHSLDVPSMHWANLFGALLRSHALQSTNEGLSIEEIEKLPLVTYCEKDHQHTSTKFQCIICLNDVQDKEVLREITHCQHKFHPSCVDPWLERSATCPLCRCAVVIEDDENGGGTSTEEAQALEPASRPPASYSDASEGAQSGSERSSAELPADSMPMQPGFISVSELPYSFAARSIDTESWSEASGIPEDDWELVEDGT